MSNLNPFAAQVAAINDQKVGGEERDSLGGGFLLTSGAYEMTCTSFWSGNFEKGAGFVEAEFIGADGQKYKIRECTSKADGSITYEKDGEKFYMPGFNKMNSLALLASRKGLADLTWEEKAVKVYNKDTQSDVPTLVPVATEMLGKKVILGILEVEVNKTVKNETTGKYDPIAETRVENQLDKVFDFESKKTISEFRAKAEKAEFYDEWVKKYSGEKQNRVKTTGLASPAAGAKQAGTTAGGGSKPVDDLFG